MNSEKQLSATSAIFLILSGVSKVLGYDQASWSFLILASIFVVGAIIIEEIRKEK